MFLFLVITQAPHSIEEYVTRLYQVFAPARFVSSLVSNNLALGFVVVNAALICIRFVVLGCSRALELALGSEVRLVMDNSGIGQTAFATPVSPYGQEAISPD